jgi:hypothetical protein
MSEDPEIGGVEWLQANLGISEEEARHWHAELGQDKIRAAWEQGSGQAKQGMVSPAEFAKEMMEIFRQYDEASDDDPLPPV